MKREEVERRLRAFYEMDPKKRPFSRRQFLELLGYSRTARVFEQFLRGETRLGEKMIKKLGIFFTRLENGEFDGIRSRERVNMEEVRARSTGKAPQVLTNRLVFENGRPKIIREAKNPLAFPENRPIDSK